MAPKFSKPIGESAKMSCEECWVTMAEDDNSANQALVLAKSLRRVVTTRKIAVVICDGVTQEKRKLLQAVFDQCLKLDMPCEKNGAPLRFYAKVFCWSLPFMKKCIFLDYDTMVLKNCDELFDIPGTSAVRNKKGTFETSVIIFEPNFEDYLDLCNWLRSGKHHDIDSGDLDMKFGDWIANRKRFGKLARKFNLAINLDDISSWNNDDLRIVRFEKQHPNDYINHCPTTSPKGTLEKALVKYWNDVYVKDVMTSQNRLQKTNVDALPGIGQSILDGNKEPIAIIGVSCRFPQANNLDEYWEILENGKDCITKVPEDRWPTATNEEFRNVQAGFLKCPVNELDGKFFNISPFELAHMDPQQRLLLEVSWEALEHAGINPQGLSGTNTGVFVGTWTQDYRDLIKNVNGEFSDFHRTYMGNSIAATSGRLSFLLGLCGPNVATESGCSSGMVAVYLACEALRKGRSNIALAAGANLLLHPFQTKHMVNVCSKDGRCKTFDEKADGFGRAEGISVLVLKRYSDAVNAGDNILALIRGCGIAQEGTSRSFGTPTKEVQEIAMRTALDDAGVCPLDVSYVEAHGTGTLIGDVTEMAAITNLYGNADRDGTSRETPLLVGSVKTNLGHTESCSGIAGIVKVILAMHHEIIPPHINLQNLNPHIKLDSNVRIPTTKERWETMSGKPRIAGISSFGITGTNTHVILQEPPKYSVPQLEFPVKDRPLHLFTFSGKSEENLDDMLASYKNFLQNNTDFKLLGDAAFTCNTGRAHFPFRTTVAAATAAELTQKLNSASNQKAQVPTTRPKLCFLFTGQGSQYQGMAKELYDSNPLFKMTFDKCDKILWEKHGISIKPALWNETKDTNLINRTLYSQTSIFCIEYCLMKLWESWGVKPDCVIGHSLGEFSAAVCAGILSFEGALELVSTRSRLIEENAPPGKMIVIKSSKSTVDKILKDFISENPHYWLDYAAFNSPDQTVLAGPPEVVEAFGLKCQQCDKALKIYILDATSAFHSRDMNHILSEYRQTTDTVKLSSPKITYISGVNGKILEDGEMNSEYWIRHTRDPVEFIEASKAAFEQGMQVFLEVGPQPVLCTLAMANSMGEMPTVLPSLRKAENEWTTLLETLSKLYQLGFDIDWVKYDQFYNRRKIHLPTYPFSRKKHWYEEKSSKQGIMFNAKSIHPLLGCQIPNATTNHIFQSSLELEKVSYLKDHCIGGLIVFPAAALLEMCLSSGCLSTIGQLELVNPLSVENLTVEAPLGMQQEENCNLQVVVSKEDNGDTKIKIYSQKVTGESSNIKWTRQATASFTPLQINYRLNEEVESLQSIQTRCQITTDTDDFYNKLGEVGLEFGTSFKSLSTLWRNLSGHEVLSEIQNHEKQITGHLVHPVVLDALIQTIMIGSNQISNNKGSLFVPLVIGRVVVFSKSTSDRFFAHCAWEEHEAMELRSATLYDAKGNLIAIMSGVQMIETTADTIVKSLTAQNLTIPNVYEEIWRPRMGPMKHRTNLDVMNGENLFSEAFSNDLECCNHLSDEHTIMVANRRKLVFCYILKAFYDLGWQPKINDELKTDDFISSLKILPSHKRLVYRYLTILQEEGVLQKSSKEEWTVIKMTSEVNNLKRVQDEIEKCVDYIKNNRNETGDAKVTIGCGERLATFLNGSESALNFLFPEDNTTEVCAETFYNESITVNAAHKALKATIEKLMKNYNSIPEEQRGIIRILEVGAGTGSTTKRILPILDENKAKYLYVYTDISPAFFVKAQPMFDKHGQKIQYKVLNIEEDPLTQGFMGNHFDLVIASNVIHATQDLSQSLAHIRSLLKNDAGLLVMVETLQPIREYDVVFGLLSGFWRFTDKIRPDYPNASGETWEIVCRQEGYDRYRYFPCFGGQVGVIISRASPNYKLNNELSSLKAATWIVFSDSTVFPTYLKPQFDQVGRNVIVVTKSKDYHFNANTLEYKVRPSKKSDFVNIFKMIQESGLKIEGISYLWGLDKEIEPVKITTGFLFLAQILLSEFKGLPKFVMVTEGIMKISDESAVDVGPATLWGMIRSFRTEHYNLHVRSVDLDPDEENKNLKYNELFAEFWNDDYEYQIAYRQRSRHVLRLVQCKDFGSPLNLPNSERFSLVLPATKNIADLKFCPNGKTQLKENEVDVEVRATGLNFRDVFVVLKPEQQFDSINCLGLEFAGIVKESCGKKFQVGDRVMGCKFADGALPSHIQMDESLLFKIPDEMTYYEASAIPAAFATAYYCLIMVARLSKGETLLIHAGSGAVGMFSIQVAKAVGANIIATAGSRRKRTFLKNLGIRHVFHSRNTEYANQILEVTHGKGVDVILNSLTSPGFKEASMSVCSENGRFVEMSKLHIWSEAEVKAIRPDVEYTIVDLTTVTKETWQSFWLRLEEYMQKDFLRPIPYTLFEAPYIREALTFMQKAKHIGKLIVAMPQMIKKESTFEPVIKIFNEISTYLITGGLGGIGIELTKWMVKNGAKHIVLMSRRPPNENAMKSLDELNAQGSNIVALSVDVGNYEQCRLMFKKLEDPKLKLPKLRGVFHAAGTLSDATYVNQSIESFETAFQGKVNGAWNLHLLTRDYNLEFFTIFSSISSILGPVGLSNYSAANAYVDALCHYRNSLGLCSQAINWGQWSEVGAAKDINMPAMKPFKPSQGLLALEMLMKTQKTQIAVLDVDFGYVRKLTSNVGTYLEELNLTKGNQGVTFTVKIGNFWDDFNECETDEKKIAKLKSYVATILRQILKFDDDEAIDEELNFTEMGMDSLMMLEMKNFLQTMLGKSISINISEMSDLTNINKLSAHVMMLIKKSGATEKVVGNTENETNNPHNYFSPELRELIQQDMILPECVTAENAEKSREKIKFIMITGVTGKLGPYMLESLLKLNSVKKIYCLIRAQDDASAKEKLRKALQEKSLLESINLNKVECFAGDITESLLGLPAEQYRKLASCVDGIVHCAVKGNLMEPYIKSEEELKTFNMNSLRTVNVIGTRNVLEFAGKVKTKRVLHASTLLACHRVDENELLFEDWCAPLDVFEMTNIGYAVSKFICEVLAHQATARGIPIQVHRFPGLLGDRNGCFSFPNNHAMLRLLGFCKVGAVPMIPVPLQVLDVDFAAEISCKLFFNDNANTGVYNITNPKINLLQDFPALAKEFGFNIDIVEYEEFSKKLSENKELASVFPYQEVDIDDGRYIDFTLSPLVMQCWSRNPNDFFISKKVEEILPDFPNLASSPIDILRRDMQYAKNKGIFAKMKLI